ncbi:MAG TPA: type IV toxin-antitoxin system AbiEi family antitoxin domain-containing protein [Solirubrobacterales bacterium]|nr:type IV toxin-antitoxin system AbiEi family antitoxin domain-containing protein [Solirubrobacterales bacterium]
MERLERGIRLAEIGRRQHGVVARDQLIELGFSPRTIDSHITARRLRRIHEGVYALGPQPLSETGRQMAALLAIRPDPLLSHITSASRQGLMRSTAEVHVSISTRIHRRMSGVTVHRPRRIDPEDRVRIDGFPMTSIPRTMLDLAQILPIPRVENVFEEADRRNLLDLDAVRDVMLRYRGHRGCRPLGRIVATYLSAPDANEGMERQFQLLLHEFGLPTPHMNVLVEGEIVDCWWPEARFVVELDSEGWHKTWRAHERDRKRDAILLRAGISTLRITYWRLHHERDEVARDVAAALGRQPDSARRGGAF